MGRNSVVNDFFFLPETMKQSVTVMMISWKDCTIHQKKLGPDYHRLKAMVKRSIEQDLRNRNFGARNGNYERNAVV